MNKTIYHVVISQIVMGKSKGPKGFKRIKPYVYSDASVPHLIIYYNDYEVGNLKEFVSNELQSIKSEMFGHFMMNKSGKCKIVDYKIILKLFSENASREIYSTMVDNKNDHLFYFKGPIENRSLIYTADNRSGISYMMHGNPLSFDNKQIKVLELD